MGKYDDDVDDAAAADHDDDQTCTHFAQIIKHTT
jgi:hypothetical protein